MYFPTTRKRPRMQAPKPDAPVRCESHLAWVRKLLCVCSEIDPTGCSGKGRACHVRRGTDGGTGSKPGDNWVFAACDGHHDEQHRLGEISFEGKYKLRLKQIAETTWRRSPHRLKYEREQQALASLKVSP